MKNYFKSSPEEKYSLGFKIIMLILALLTASVILFAAKNAFPLYCQNQDTVPVWFPYTSIIFPSLAFIGLILTYLYYKVGNYIFVVSLLALVSSQPDFSIHFYLPPVFLLFLYTVFGLFYIVPGWKHFK